MRNEGNRLEICTIDRPCGSPRGLSLSIPVRTRSELGITPVNNGEVVRIPLPPLTEENRRDLAKRAKGEGENSRVSIRNIRRDVIADIRELVKEKEASEDDARRGEDRVQELTDRRIAQVDSALAAKESELMEI
jgi:ribosome recycling factor